jgi:hypothetical protein
MANGERVGEVTHFFSQLGVAVVNLSQPLQVGDIVHFLGRNTDFEQEITSMQIDHEFIDAAYADDQVAIKVDRRVRSGDSVYLIL